MFWIRINLYELGSRILKKLHGFGPNFDTDPGKNDTNPWYRLKRIRHQDDVKFDLKKTAHFPCFMVKKNFFGWRRRRSRFQFFLSLYRAILLSSVILNICCFSHYHRKKRRKESHVSPGTLLTWIQKQVELYDLQVGNKWSYMTCG